MDDLHPARGGLLAANRDIPIGDNMPAAESWNAETVPVPTPALCALDTNS